MSNTTQADASPASGYAHHFTSPSGIMLGVCLVIFLLLSMSGDSKKKKLAKGHLAGSKEKNAAFKLMEMQFKSQERDVSAFRIKRKGEPGFLALPSCQPGIMVVGGPGTGKSASIINPLYRSAIDQFLPIIMFDWKYPEQSSEIASYAAAKGYKNIHVFAPGFPASQRLNPLDLIKGHEDMLGARELAESMLKNDSDSPEGTAKFFQDSAASLLAPLFSMAKQSRYPDLLTVNRFLETEDLIEKLKASKATRFQRMLLQPTIAAGGSSKQLAAVLTTAQRPLMNFLLGDQLINSVVGPTSFNPILGPGEMLIFGMDRENSNALTPILAAAMSLCVKRNLLNAARKTPLVVGLDEATRLSLPYDEWLNTYRSDGFMGILGLQTPDQIKDDSIRRAILTGCPVKFIFNPNEKNTAKDFSEWVGKEEVDLKNKSKGRSAGKTNRSTSEREQAVEIFQPSDILKLGQGSAIVINPGYKNKKEAAVPFLHQFSYKKKDQNQKKAAKKVWEKELNPKLIDIAVKLACSVDEMLKNRRNEVNKKLPKIKKPAKGRR